MFYTHKPFTNTGVTVALLTAGKTALILLRGGEVVTRQAHNLENAGAHPAPATRYSQQCAVRFTVEERGRHSPPESFNVPIV